MALTYSTDDPGQAQDMHSAKPAASSSKAVNADGASSDSAGAAGGSASSTLPGSVSGNADLCLESYSIDADGIAITTRANATCDSDNTHRGMVSHSEPDGTVQVLPNLVELVLPPRSLYILRGPWRYNYNHAILGLTQVPHLVPPLPEPPTQRSSVMFRDVKA